jgi:P-type E1-E2 ATPase
LHGNRNKVVTGSELANMSDTELIEILPNLAIVARALPSDKSRLIRIAQSMELVTGMTGDGINDAPALKIADVGFAMGSGTEIAKEAAECKIIDLNMSAAFNELFITHMMFPTDEEEDW